MDIEELSFDVYQRFAGIRDLARSLELPEGARILDVGGHPGTLADCLTGAFPSLELLTLDRPLCRRENYISASAESLPLPDGAVELVISSDMLEHLTPGGRAAALREMLRVAKSWVILGAPFHSPAVAFAEEKINALFEKCNRRTNQWLSEHLKNGLPDIRETLDILGENGAGTRVYPNGSIQSWFLLEAAGILLDAFPLLSRMKSPLSVRFNRYWAREDNQEPAYRHLILVDKTGETTGESFPSSGDSGAALEKLRALFEIFDETAEEIASLLEDPRQRSVLITTRYIRQLEEVVEFQEKDLKRLRDTRESQEKYLASLRSNSLYRLLHKLRIL